MGNSFISNVNALSAIQEVLQSLNENIEEIKDVNSNSSALEKVLSLETSILTLNSNITDLLLLSNSITKLINVSDGLSEIEKVNDNYDDFLFKHDEVNSLISKFRVEIDNFFVLFPQINTIHENIINKNTSINKNVLLANTAAASASTSAGVASAAKNAIDSKYDVYLEATTIKDEVVTLASKSNEISSIYSDLNKIISVFDIKNNINTIVSFEDEIKLLSLNVDEIKDAIIITTDAKEVSLQNATATSSNAITIEKYKDETLDYRNETLNLKDLAVKTLDEMTPIVNKINRQTDTNSKLAFSVHDISTKLSIEFGKTLVEIKKLFEEKELALDVFASDLITSLSLDFENAKNAVKEDVKTSSLIVSSISSSLSLLTDAKHRENKNEIRFNNSELVSLLSISKMMVANKIIKADTTDAIDNSNRVLELELKLKDNELEKIKMMFNDFTKSTRLELLVAKSLLTDIKLSSL